ncbi:RHS repeat-associated core domain-containing protein [Catenovulum sediminis]|uniref:RHS repeat-associated core domain-containing protein n=1 Tax=Catenovulum sediminis TaxID=1740262 RepID=A0ABV1RGI3_9ALTE
MSLEQPQEKANSLDFTGHVKDKSGLVYMQARYYDPLLGRFYSNDPVGYVYGNVHSFNRYSYANNNPYTYVDPDGQYAHAVARASYWVGSRTFTPAINYGIRRFTGAKNLGSWIYQKTHEDGSVSTPNGVTANPDGTVTDAEGNPIVGEAGGEGAGKRFKPESEETQAENDSAPCTYCGIKTTNESGHSNSRERDHKIAKSKGGNNSSNNEANACRTCNRSKGAKDLWTWVKDKFSG